MDVTYTDEGSTYSSETLVRNYQITRRLISEDSNLMTQAKLYKLGSWHIVVKQQRNRRPRLRAIGQFYPKGTRICQNSLLISPSGRRFDAERQIIMAEKDRQ
jgi:hypothetical protein